MSKNDVIVFHLDSDRMRRCFTINPSDEIKKLGIAKMNIKPKTNLLIFVHSPGILRALRSPAKKTFYLFPNDPYKLIQFNVVHKQYELLDHDGEECENDPDYEIDSCVDGNIFKVRT